MSFRFPISHGLSPPFTSHYSRNRQTIKAQLRLACERCYPSHEAKASGISAYSFNKLQHQAIDDYENGYFPNGVFDNVAMLEREVLSHNNIQNLSISSSRKNSASEEKITNLIKSDRF